MSETSKPRKNKYNFNTEYTDLSADGLNTNLKEYSVSFKDTQANIETLDATLTSLNATAIFLWNPYADIDSESIAIPVLCTEWDTSYDSPAYSVLTAKFKQQADTL